MYDVPVWREETSLLLFSISQDLDPFADYSLVVLPVHDIPELSLKLRRAQFCDFGFSRVLNGISSGNTTSEIGGI